MSEQIEIMIFEEDTGMQLFMGKVNTDKDGNPVIPDTVELKENFTYKIWVANVFKGADFIG